MKSFLLVLFLMGAPFMVQAMEAGEALSKPQDEARALALGQGLRCMVCQGESINDSPADLALAMRALVREKIVAGWQDEAILAYMQERYGDKILMKPPLRSDTALLWLAPLISLGVGAAFAMSFFLSKKKRKPDC